MPRAFGYVRGSIDRLVDILAIQKQAILEYFEWRLKHQGYTWGGFYEDAGVSGKRVLGSRPAGLALALELEPGDAVIIHKLDRAFRRCSNAVSEIEHWQAKRVACHILQFNIDTSTPIGKLVVAVLAAVAEMETSLISERQRDSQRLRKANGRATGRAPYGFKNVGKYRQRMLVPDPRQRKIGAFVVRQKLAAFSYKQIHDDLFYRKKPILSRDGKELTRNHLTTMFFGECQLLRETKAGRAKLKRWVERGKEIMRQAGRKVDPDPKTEAQ